MCATGEEREGGREGRKGGREGGRGEDYRRTQIKMTGAPCLSQAQFPVEKGEGFRGL